MGGTTNADIEVIPIQLMCWSGGQIEIDDAGNTPYDIFYEVLKEFCKENNLQTNVLNDFEYYKHDDYMLRHYDHTDTGNTDRVIDWLLLDKIPDEYKRKLDDKLSHVNVVRNKNFSFLMESRGE